MNYKQQSNQGCLQAFLDLYPQKHALLYVDNLFYLKTLQKYVAHSRITMVYKKNNNELLQVLVTPFIAYIDNHITDDWTHLPHFVLVTKIGVKYYTIFDPWEGKDTRIYKDKLLRGICLLRDHIRVRPIIIAAN